MIPSRRALGVSTHFRENQAFSLNDLHGEKLEMYIDGLITEACVKGIDFIILERDVSERCRDIIEESGYSISYFADNAVKISWGNSYTFPSECEEKTFPNIHSDYPIVDAVKKEIAHLFKEVAAASRLRKTECFIGPLSLIDGETLELMGFTVHEDNEEFTISW